MQPEMRLQQVIVLGMFLVIMFAIVIICKPLLLQLGYDREVTSSSLSHLHAYFRDGRQINIHARPELNEAQMLVDVAILAFLGICDNAACNGSSYLTAQNIFSVRSCDHDICMLILLAGLR